MRRFVASSFGLGLIPRRLWGSDTGAGTFGAALAWAIAGALLWLDAPWWANLAVAAALTAVALWAAVPFARNADPGWVAIDEVAGTMVASIGLHGLPWVAALAAARLLDIFKFAPGVRAAERLPGTAGVTADDVVAGLYGLGIGWLLTAL